MKLSTGIEALFLLSSILAFAISLYKGGFRQQLRWQPGPTGVLRLLIGLPALLLPFVLAVWLKLDMGGTVLQFITGYALYWVLSCLALTAPARGIILLLVGYFWFPVAAGNAELSQLPLLAYVFGLITGHLSNPDGETNTGWQNLAIPATGLIGHYWIASALPESLQASSQGLLLITLSISLLLHAIQRLELLPQASPLLSALFIVLCGGSGSYLAIQTFLLQPSLLNWAWLYTGGLVLAAVLNRTESDHNTLINRLIQVVLIGLATLVASRLFGTLGWLVLAAGMLTTLKPGKAVAAAVLFWLSRSLLQGFINQYDPNVTGINITHPYAGAALYIGFTLMLLLPPLLNRWAATEETPGENPMLYTVNPLSWILLLLGCTLAGGLANYFLHAEAAASLLVALTVAGFGVSLLGSLRPEQSPQPLLFAMLITNSAILFNDLVTAGNEAEKTQKALVLAGALVLYVLMLWLMNRSCSGRKPVEVV